MHRSVVLSVVVLCLSPAAAMEMKFGGCPDVLSMTPFDITKYTGLWYEVEKTPNQMEAGLKCLKAILEKKDDHVSIVYKGLDENSGEEIAFGAKGTAPDKNVPGHMKIRFDYWPVAFDYYLFDTDYENYSLVYSCNNVWPIFHLDYVWIWSRQKTIDDATRDKLYKMLDNYKISKKELTAMKQDCS